ncbi:MAG: 4-(cytidine 5'-diphospho)-2-C-methyl-D-erythritol kinase [Clostridia bacterium]|nr:4-(cytidine 5'-diphospho)-2-C-methyl-D-erythritol kinase [Clostridia bacterium]
MNTVRLNAYAKLNLTLDITGEEGGYHLLDSLVCSIDLSDRIVVKKRKDALVNVYMHGMKSEEIPPEQNNAVKAGEVFVRAFSTCGADVHVYKNIPMGAGLGGSSADAAGVLAGMAKLYNIPLEKVTALAATLGSDTAYMVSGGFARMRGRGEQVQPLNGCPRLYFLLLAPKEGVSTKACFARADEEKEGRIPCTERAIEALTGGNAEALGKRLKNDLYPAAATLNQSVALAKKEAEDFSPLGASMTGSGSAVFALFETRELCEWAKSRYRGKARAYVVRTVEPNKERNGWRNPFVLSEEERAL